MWSRDAEEPAQHRQDAAGGSDALAETPLPATHHLPYVISREKEAISRDAKNVCAPNFTLSFMIRRSTSGLDTVLAASGARVQAHGSRPAAAGKRGGSRTLSGP